MRDRLAGAEDTVARAETRQLLAGKIEEELNELEKQGITEDEVKELRNYLTSLIRETGCQPTRLDFGPAQRRKWRTIDDPIEPRNDPKAKDTSYQLRSQQMNLSVIGETAQIKKLLGHLSQSGKMIHTDRFELKPIRNTSGLETDKSDQVQLDMLLILYDLESDKKEQEKKSA